MNSLRMVFLLYSQKYIFEIAIVCKVKCDFNTILTPLCMTQLILLNLAPLMRAIELDFNDRLKSANMLM